MLKWKRLGQLFDPTVDRPKPWMQEFCQCPFPLVLDEDRLRVYVTSRPTRDSDLQYVSYPAFVDLDRSDPGTVLGVADQPLLPLGSTGTFDEFGITPTSFVRVGNEIRAYYTGWTRMQSVPYTMAIGMAVSTDGGSTFARIGQGPVMAPSVDEPFLLSGPIVKRIGDGWHMWYLTGTKWLAGEGKQEPVYRIVHATSDDGVRWDRDGIPIIPTVHDEECQVSFALFRRGDLWNVIFAYRRALDFRDGSSNSYRLGYAWSDDLERWHRADAHLNLPVSDEGWDSEMMCYPQVGEVDGRLLLFYCGNEFGRYGFGGAELVDWSDPR